MSILIAIVLIVVVIAGISVGVRRAGDDPAEWHIDPMSSPTSSKPNWYRLVPADADVDRDPDRDGVPPDFDVGATVLSAAFDRVAQGEGRVEVLTGLASHGFVTYVQRSAFFGFPDYISVRFIDIPGGRSTIAIISRARYGQSDLGVNEKRVARWTDGTTKALR